MNREANVFKEIDLVERLVRAADRGPEIPPDGAQRVKNAIRAQWRQGVRQRARRRRLWAGAAAAVAASVVLAVGLVPGLRRPAPVVATTAAVVDAVLGEVEIMLPAGGLLRLEGGGPGVAVPSGSLIRTDPGSRAAFRLVGGQSLRLDFATSVFLENPAVVDLRAGGIYLSSDGARGEKFLVRTALGMVREIGTKFEVRGRGGPLVIKVRDGLVSLSSDGDELEIAQGTGVEIAPDGTILRSRISAYGSDWDWVQQVAPTFEIEGRTVMAFLEWVAEETGLQISYDNGEVERFTQETILHGRLNGLVPAAAPEVVLPTCGLVATRVGGLLMVEASQGSKNGR